MKKYVALLLTLSLELGMLPISLAEDDAFVEREVPVILEDGGTDAIAVRFYPDQPNVPYIGLKAYSEYLGNNPLSCEKGADGTLVFSGAQGVKAIADPEAGTLLLHLRQFALQRSIALTEVCDQRVRSLIV